MEEPAAGQAERYGRVQKGTGAQEGCQNSPLGMDWEYQVIKDETQKERNPVFPAQEGTPLLQLGHRIRVGKAEMWVLFLVPHLWLLKFLLMSKRLVPQPGKAFILLGGSNGPNTGIGGLRRTMPNVFHFPGDYSLNR